MRPAHLSTYAFCLLSISFWTTSLYAQSSAVDVSAEHPLLIFAAPDPNDEDFSGYPVQVAAAWEALPESIRPYSILKIESGPGTMIERHQRMRTMLSEITSVPLVLEIADGNPASLYALGALEELLNQYPNVRGVHAAGLTFNEYYEFGDMDPLGLPHQVRWLVNAIEVAARNDRIITIELDGLNWPRVMSNTWCEPLYEAIRRNRDHVLPLVPTTGPHLISAMASLMGLWLEGSVSHWGIAPTSQWYREARFISPGVFGNAKDDSAMPPFLYRAMILNGAMTGAAVLHFDDAEDLVYGLRRYNWDQAILPTLEEILDHGYIARQDLVQRKARVAYRLASARTSRDFHRNLADIDAEFDAGNLLRGAYGLERPGQIPELILNSGLFYWVPIVSATGPPDLPQFEQVVSPGEMNSPQNWTELLDAHYKPDGFGTAFVTRVGRGIFVMNTSENDFDEQTFRLLSVPAPMRAFRAERGPDGILLTWPYREGDFAYRVYRRILPDTNFSVVASDLDGRRYLDPDVSPTDTIAYALTALTNEKEPFEGTVNFGEYLIVNTAESRITEEAVVYPLAQQVNSTPVVPRVQARVLDAPDPAALAPDRKDVTLAIEQRLEAWGVAFEDESLADVLDFYAQSYADTDGGNRRYVEQAYQWFFSRYDSCKMHRQVRRWDFGDDATSQRVDVLLYCRFTGVALTDPSGRFADQPAHFPRTDSGEVWMTMENINGAWRITSTDPSLPSFIDLLPLTTPRVHPPFAGATFSR